MHLFYREFSHRSMLFLLMLEIYPLIKWIHFINQYLLFLITVLFKTPLSDSLIVLRDNAASDVSSCITLVPVPADTGTKTALKYLSALGTLFSKFPEKPLPLTTPCAWEGSNTSFPANPNPNSFTCYSEMQLTYFVTVAAAFAAFHLGLCLLAAALSMSSLMRRW